jgi:Tfp pilus assembly protein PilF
LVLSDLDAAEDHFLHALALDPRDVDALTLLGNLYMQRERAADAIPLYERSIALQPSVYALANLGAALAKTNRVPEAIASFHRAIAVDDTYPNAWYGLGLALSELGTVDALREAIGALERALTASMGKQETRPVYQESQRLLASLSPAVAQGLVQEAQSTIAATMSEQAERFGVPIKLEHEDLPGIDAKIEYAWVHHRPFHRLITGTRPSPAREHHALHELEHLRLTNAARAAGRNRWFGSSMEGSQRAVTAMGNDLARLANQGIPPAQLAQYSQSLVSGLLLQLYNFPLDLLIETRLLETHPELREVFFTSVHQQLATSTRLVEDQAIRQQTPKIIHRASMAMNGAFVLWFDQHYPNRTDFLARFSRSDVWPLAKQLYRMWTERAATWTPGDELDWVDEWATKLGTKDWYQWVDGNTESAST